MAHSSAMANPNEAIEASSTFLTNQRFSWSFMAGIMFKPHIDDCIASSKTPHEASTMANAKAIRRRKLAVSIPMVARHVAIANPTPMNLIRPRDINSLFTNAVTIPVPNPDFPAIMHKGAKTAETMQTTMAGRHLLRK